MRFVVVGAGPAGCAFAHAVAPDHDVVVVEAGLRHEPEPGGVRPRPEAADRRVTVGVRRAGSGVADAGTGGLDDHGDDRYVCGRGVGGGSLVNGGFVVGSPGPAAPLPIESPRSIGPLARALLASHPGARVGHLVADGGRRVDLGARYLDGHDSIAVLTGRTVERLVLDGGRVVGVVADDGTELGGDVVVLCAGALATPTIMLRSGIGDPGIGAGLHDTTSVPLVLELAAEPADVAPLTVSAETRGHRLVTVERAEAAGFGVLLVSLVSATSRGRLTLPDRAGPPRIELDQLVTATDRRAIVAAVLDAVDTLRQVAWRDAVDAVAVDAHGTTVDDLGRDPDRILAWATTHLGGTYHATATCSTVCGDDGAVRGLAGLVVADASVLPATPARNTFLAVVARAGELGRRWRGSPGAPGV